MQRAGDHPVIGIDRRSPAVIEQVRRPVARGDQDGALGWNLRRLVGPGNRDGGRPVAVVADRPPRIRRDGRSDRPRGPGDTQNRAARDARKAGVVEESRRGGVPQDEVGGSQVGHRPQVVADPDEQLTGLA